MAISYLYLDNLVKWSKIVNNGVSMLIQDGQCNKKHKLVSKIVAPQDFPHDQGIIPWKFSLEPDKEPAEAEKEIVTISTLEMLV